MAEDIVRELSVFSETEREIIVKRGGRPETFMGLRKGEKADRFMFTSTILKIIEALEGQEGSSGRVTKWAEVALETYEGLAAEYDAEGDKLRAGYQHGFMGDICRKLDRIGDALAHHEISATMAEAGGNLKHAYTQHGFAGNTAVVLGRREDEAGRRADASEFYRTALDHFETAITMSEADEISIFSSHQHSNAADMCMSLGRMEDAFMHAKTSSEQAESVGDFEFAADQMNFAGAIAVREGMNGDAYQCFKVAAKIAQKAGNPKIEYSGQSSAADTAVKMGRLDNAYKRNTMAAEIAEGMIKELTNPEEMNAARVNAVYSRVFAGKNAMKMAYGRQGGPDPEWKARGLEQLCRAKGHLKRLIRDGVDVEKVGHIFEDTVHRSAGRLHDPEIERQLSIAALGKSRGRAKQ